VAHMPTTLPVPRVPLGFLSLAAAGGQTTLSSDQIILETEVGGQTATPGGQTARPHVTLSSVASPTSIVPRAAPTIPHAPPAAPASPHYSHCPRATREPPAPPLLQQSPPAKAVPVAPPVNPHLMTTRTKRGFRLPANKLTLSAASSSLLSLVPTSVCTSLADPSWRRAMEEEYAALISNNTWDLVPHLVGSNVVTGKWIFKHKFNFDGTLERYKAHWVLRGFTQRPDVDYDETFNPVVKPATIHMVLSLVVSCFWPIHQLDVKNVFLHGTLLKTVYCSEPTGFVDLSQSDRVCRLNKSLYGLKQVPQACYNQFVMYLLTLGFVEAKSDTSLFIFRRDVDMVYLLLYADDIVLTASSTTLLQHTISALKRGFPMKDLSPLHCFLGVFIV
jgi:hypothetical protein